MSLTLQRIEWLAPDQESLAAARKLLKPSSWPTLAEGEGVATGNPDLVDILGVEHHPFRHSSFYFTLGAILAAVRDCLCTRAALQIEVLALRHQLNVLQRSVKRPKLTAADRFL
jgi:hypothetical protein